MDRSSILRASTINTEARRWRASLLARAENRRSQNQLRALRAKNNSQDCFYGAARRRANPRASTINTTTWENSQVVLFCKQG